MKKRLLHLLSILFIFSLLSCKNNAEYDKFMAEYNKVHDRYYEDTPSWYEYDSTIIYTNHDNTNKAIKTEKLYAFVDFNPYTFIFHTYEYNYNKNYTILKNNKVTDVVNITKKSNKTSFYEEKQTLTNGITKTFNASGEAILGRFLCGYFPEIIDIGDEDFLKENATRFVNIKKNVVTIKKIIQNDSSVYDEITNTFYYDLDYNIYKIDFERKHISYSLNEGVTCYLKSTMKRIGEYTYHVPTSNAKTEYIGELIDLDDLELYHLEDYLK